MLDPIQKKFGIAVWSCNLGIFVMSNSIMMLEFQK